MDQRIASWFVCITVFVLVCSSVGISAEQGEVGRSSGGLGHKLGNFFSVFKQASRQGASFLGDMAASIPFGKIALGGGALLGLFLLFLRLLIVLGPILILGAMTRESTDATDLLRMLIEFYNQIILSLEEQSPIQPTIIPQTA